MQPIVSIILPTFGRLHYLRQTVASVYAQSLRDWELIVADDGSDEETRAYLRALGADPRVRLLWLPHSGVPAVVRNAALREAQAPYIAFLDSDDLWAAQKLQRQVEALGERSGCRWCYTAFLRIDARGDPLPEEAERPWVPHQGEIFAQVVTSSASIRTPSVLAARQLIAQAGGFDEAMRSAEDYDLWLRLALLSDVAVIDEPLVYVRCHDDNHTREWQSAFAGRDRFLRRHQQLVDPARAALMRAERSRNALQLAATHARLGARGPMLRALWESLPYSWAYSRWWLGALRIVLRSQLPARVLEVYRERRRGMRAARSAR
ncbi:MAG: glycosyltransferase [Gammaproteobacteria bacterium]|nr:glycosyltransferase [Gammaproteobacteria bacterium]